ncbi:MAG: YiiX/YebB-like N1pC/P60 family cysteine hydrolase [Roseiflexaceae bacterium]
MRTRLLLALLLALTVLVNMITPTTAHAQSITVDDAIPANAHIDQDAQIDTTTAPSANTNNTAHSTRIPQHASYTDIGLALFSAQSQAEIDQLSALFDAARVNQPTTRAQSRNARLGTQITRAITGETNYKKKLPSNALTSIVRKGDILLRRTGIKGCTLWNVVPLCKYWAQVYEHAGIYYGKDKYGTFQVYESTNIGGVQFKPVITWQQQGQYVGIHRSRSISSSTLSRSLDALVQRYGHLVTPYNYNFVNKTTDRALYCSQLAWKYFMSMGVNIDSNSPIYAKWLVGQYGGAIGNYVGYHAVAPDEIGLSSALVRLYSGWN